MVLKDIHLEEDLSKIFQTALFNIREGKKIEKTNVQDAIGEYLLSINHFMSCIAKLNECSISYPSTEQDTITMMDYMCNKAKKMNFTSAYFEFVEQAFKLTNTCPVVFSESTLSLLTHFNQGHITQIENYEKMVVESSASKNDRLAAELDGKILKWEINIRKKEFIYQLRKQMESQFEYSAIYYLFSGDYRCKLEILNSLKENLTQVDLTIINLDLILKWCTLMLMKNNPLLVYKVLDYLSDLFTMLRKNDYVLTDHELYYFLPYLLRKMFNSRPIVRKTVSGLFKLIAHSTNAAKCCDIIIDLMNKTDLYPLNLGCIDQLDYLISFFGLESLDHGRLMTKLCSYIRDKRSGDAGRNSLVALANAKIKSVHILRQYLAENEIGWIPEPVIEKSVAEKINLKTRIEHFGPFVFTNTAHFESSIRDIFHGDLDIAILNLINVDFFLANVRNCELNESYLNVVIYSVVKKIHILVVEVFKSHSMIRYEFLEVLFDTLTLIFNLNLKSKCDKSCFKFMLFTFLDLTSVPDYEKIDGLLVNKLHLTINYLFSKYDATLGFEALFELLSDVASNVHPSKDVTFGDNFLNELIRFMDIRIYLFLKHLPPEKMIKDMMNVGEFLVFTDTFILVNPMKFWDLSFRQKYFYRIIHFLVEIIKQTSDIMNIFESIKCRLRAKTTMEYIVSNALKEKESQPKK